MIVFKFQSRIKLYLLRFFFVRFLFSLIKSVFFKDEKNIKLLEKELSSYYNAKNAKLVGQCREGLYWSIKYSIEISGKSEVIISPYTLFYVINMIVHAGGKPVFVDLSKDSLETNLEIIKNKVSQNTAAIVLTHLSGINKEIIDIKDFTKKNYILLIEDMAVSLGSSLKEYSSPIVIGDIGVISFHALKNVQCLNGGVIIHSDNNFLKWLDNKNRNFQDIKKIFLVKRLIFFFLVNFLTKTKVVNLVFFQLIKFAYLKKLNFILNFVRPDHRPNFNSTFPSYYFKKISSVQAKYLRISFKNISRDQQKRYQNALKYRKLLMKIKEIKIPDEHNFEVRNHLEFPILCKDRDELFNFLLKDNIDVRKFYYRNCASLDIYSEYHDVCKNADEIENTILSLPCYPEYSEYNINRTVNQIKKFYKI